MKRPPLLLLDTSVVLSALLSDRGGSSGIFDLAGVGLIHIAITEAIALEAHAKVQQKFGVSEVVGLRSLLTTFKSAIKPSPVLSDLKKYNHLIVDQNDRHILAGAVNYGVDYLITLDKKHFFTEKLERADLGFIIRTPGEFLKEFREQFESNG